MMNNSNTITHEDFRGLSGIEASQKMMGYLIMMIAKNGLRTIEIDSSDLFVLEANNVDNNQNIETEKEIEALQLLCSDVMDWMIREGLIRVSNQQTLLSGQSHYLGVNLTSQGMVISQQNDKEYLNNESVKSLIDKGKDSNDIYIKAGSFVGAAIAGISKGFT